jgi:hypothetical protein
MFLEIVASTTVVGPTAALTIILESDNDVAFGTPTDVLTITPTDQTPAAGEYIWQGAMPTINERYTRLTASWTTGASAGALNAYLTDSPQASWSGS